MAAKLTAAAVSTTHVVGCSGLTLHLDSRNLTLYESEFPSPRLTHRRKMKKRLIFCLFPCICVFGGGSPGNWFFTPVGTAHAGTVTPYVDFNDFPKTEPDAVPGSSNDWIYTTAQTNPQPGYYMTTYDSAGWRTRNAYPEPNAAVHDLFYRYGSLPYNSSHMGFETYGYLEIDGTRAVVGNSLRYRVTGGKNANTCPDGNSGPLPCNASGLKVTTKEGYLDYIENGQDPVEGDQAMGHPYIYFSNTSQNANPVPFVQAPGHNRLSLYVYLPDEVENGPGGYTTPPAITLNIGPYNGIGGHWYHHYTFQGGGWAHVIVDGHPQHNNAWSSASLYPYPSSSMRNMDIAYFNGMYRWYLTTKPYDGVAAPPYSVWIDEIEFQLDDEPQNSETICSPSILHHASSNLFEVGFMDKYKNNGKSYATYEAIHFPKSPTQTGIRQRRYGYSKTTGLAFPPEMMESSRNSGPVIRMFERPSS